MACLNARRSLSTLLSRALTSSSSSSSSFPSRSRLTVALLNKTPVFIPDSTKIQTRTKTSGSPYLPLNDPSRLPSVFLYGCDYEHWLIILEFPNPKPLKEEMIDTYVKTLASVVGSEEEAKKRIYSVYTTRYTGFRAFFPEDMVEELRGLPRVRWVLPVWCRGRDYYNGGDLFVDGNVIHRPPQHSVGGCADYDLWLINFKSPRNIDFYVKTLASVVGSEEEAKRRIYAIGGKLTKYTGFRAVISEEMAYELQGLPL
ncbi:hypothetical protein J1N35_045704 [Gossypium stocksii]|uniref:MORF/ORRM1/DAG-like MORF domain-containing protein n=1 Tax=Gossypium stocksii TaxID=47602 RepID=A0A9D3ZHB0_9ROSI|nr:hypothetical protein J1N35_045704 [Gossypium stocksii]